MLPVVTPAEMAAVDRAAPEPVEVLVERAGRAVARVAREILGGTYGRRVVVVAGKGNNGADGRVAAERLRRIGVHVTLVEAADAPPRLPAADLVIDAAYGTGLRGGYDAPDPGGAPVLAVDIPSGVSGVTGEVEGAPLRAVRTVTFAALKPGLLLHPGRSLAGEVTVVDIGLDVGRATAGLVSAADVASWVPRRAVDAHKWRSAVVVVAGGPGMTGAAHLVASAAQRAGAGMVRLATPGVTDDALRPIEAVGIEVPSRGWDTTVLEATDRAGAVVIGPGLGLAAPTSAAVRRVVAEASVPIVVDGDALTALGRESSEVLGRREVLAVLTPHDGEAERLTGRRPGPDRLAEARQLAAATASVVVLKGSTTVVAHPDGRARFVTTGDERLATAGTGDVLAGTIGALLASGAETLDAAAAGAWLHGLAASHCPRLGVVASDVVAALPAALAELDLAPGSRS